MDRRAKVQYLASRGIPRLCYTNPASLGDTGRTDLAVCSFVCSWCLVRSKSFKLLMLIVCRPHWLTASTASISCL
jgi:hypothetical protein